MLKDLGEKQYSMAQALGLDSAPLIIVTWDG